MNRRVGFAILAAGASRRLGQPKQLVQVRGRALVEHAARAGCGSECAATALVVGARALQVASVVQRMPVQVIENQHWREGIAASIRCAVDWAAQRRFHALIVGPCDQPRLDSMHLDALVRRFEDSNRLVASYYSGQRGVPVLFPANYFGNLLALQGDCGAQLLVRREQDVDEIDWPDGGYDIDYPGQLHALE